MSVFDKVEEFLDDLQSRTLPSALSIESALVRLEQEKDVTPINNLLFSQMKAGTLPVLVMFGNPSDAAISALRSLDGVEIEKIVAFDELVKDVVAGGSK